MNHTHISGIVNDVIDEFLAKADTAKARQRAEREDQKVTDRSRGAMTQTFVTFTRNNAAGHGMAARAHKRARRACMEAGYAVLANYHSRFQQSHQILADELAKAARK